MSTKALGKSEPKHINPNLQPWKPGQSGNPLGRPKKEFSLTDGMRDYLYEKDPDTKQRHKDLLIQKTFMLAKKGDIAAIKLIWNYLEGMPEGTQPIIPIQQNISITLESPELYEDSEDTVEFIKRFLEKNPQRKGEI